VSSTKKALRKFMDAILSAPEGCDFEIGLVFDRDQGWRVYQRVHTKALLMAPAMARSLADTYDKLAARPEWAAIGREMKNTFEELRNLANEADQKNRDKVLPPDYAAFAPAQGSA
jgi:hypothetical protein